MQRPDGTEGDPRPVVFNLTQKGTELTGTGGPAEQQWTIEKGAVTAGKATTADTTRVESITPGRWRLTSPADEQDAGPEYVFVGAYFEGLTVVWVALAWRGRARLAPFAAVAVIALALGSM